MADEMKLHFQRVHFGLASPGAMLKFSIKADRGFAVRAILDRDAIVVGRWEFEELKDGTVFQEPLVPKGTYSLTLHVAFTDKKDATLEMMFDLDGKKRTRKMTGKDPDIGRALAVVFIQ